VDTSVRAPLRSVHGVDTVAALDAVVVNLCHGAGAAHVNVAQCVLLNV